MKRSDKTIDMTAIPSDPAYTFKEWPCFRYMGLPAAKRDSLKFLFICSGPSQLTKMPLLELRYQMAVTARNFKAKTVWYSKSSLKI